MIVYIPGTRVREMTELLWKCLIDDREGRLFQVKTLSDGTEWMMVETSLKLTLSNSAHLGGISEILQPYIDSGYLPNGSISELENTVTLNKGKDVTLWNIFPKFFKEIAKSSDFLVSEGKLNQMEA